MAPQVATVYESGEQDGLFWVAMEYVDGADLSQSLNRGPLPEDHAAPQYQDRQFAVNLTFVIEGQPRSYSFRYEVASVLPR